MSKHNDVKGNARKMKKILNNIITVIAWIILAFALIVTILVFSSDRNNGVASLFGYVPLDASHLCKGRFHY